jgi:hypothetical protein
MKFQLVILVICGLVLLSINLQGQYRIDPEVENSSCSLTGNLQFDLLTKINSDSSVDSSDVTHTKTYQRLYSPLQAGLFSAVVPGAGQFYTKNYWQSAAFFGAEVVLWIVYATYENKANDQTDLFQKYADGNWSVVRYASWINREFSQAIAINANSSIQPWERVSWNELNDAEEAIGGTTGTGFTHKLAPHGDQQYYEMIGKYSQFGGGWSDASGFTKADVIANNGIGNVTPQFHAYSKMRGDANSFYNIASTVSYIIVANHVLSALEAVWNASKSNHRIKLEGHIESRKIERNTVEFVPTLHVQYEL